MSQRWTGRRRFRSLAIAGRARMGRGRRDAGGERRKLAGVGSTSCSGLVGFALTLGAGVVMGGSAPVIAIVGKPKVGIAIGVVGGLAFAIGLPGVIVTALVRDARLQLASARLGVRAAGPWVRL